MKKCIRNTTIMTSMQDAEHLARWLPKNEKDASDILCMLGKLGQLETAIRRRNNNTYLTHDKEIILNGIEFLKYSNALIKYINNVRKRETKVGISPILTWHLNDAVKTIYNLNATI